MTMASLLHRLRPRRARVSDKAQGSTTAPAPLPTFRSTIPPRHVDAAENPWSFKSRLPGFSPRRRHIAIPARVDGPWVDQQLSGLAALTQTYGEAAVGDFLEQLLMATGVREDWVLQARVLCVLAERLAAMTPLDEGRLRSCVQRMGSLLAQHDGTVDVVRLKLRGAMTRLRQRFQQHGEAQLSPAGTLLRANELLARSLRKPGETQALTTAGEAYLDAGRYEIAGHCLQKAENWGVQDGGRAAFFLGQCAFHLEHYEPAAQAFGRAVEQGWPRAEVTSWQAGALYEIDRDDEAEECARVGLGQAQGKSAALLQALLGKIHLGRQETEAAKQWFIQADAAADCTEARYGLGVCAIACGDTDVARELFTALLDHPEGGPLGALGLGMLAAEHGDVPLAIQHLTEAVRHFPSHGVAHACLGECLFDAGEYAQALRHLSQARDLGVAQSTLLLRSGLAACATGDLETAYALFGAYQEAGDREIDATPYLCNVLVRMTNDALVRNDLARALFYAEDCYQLAPDHPGVAERLGFLRYSAAWEQITTGQASEQTGDMFARAWELCKTEATLAGALLTLMFVQGTASLAEALAMLGADEADFGDFSFLAWARLFDAYRRRDTEAIARSLHAIGLDDPLLGKMHSMERLIALHRKVGWQVTQTRSGDKLTADDMTEILRIGNAPEFKQAFAAQRETVNRLLVSLLFEGQGRRAALVLQAVEALALADQSGFWDEARAFAQLLNASRANDALVQCRNLVVLCRELPAVDKPFIVDLLMRAEWAEIAKLLEVPNFAHAYELLAVQGREGRADALSRQVADAIATFLSTDSLEGAHLAKSVGDTQRARAIWEALVRQGNAEAAHQMAVSLFTQGYEEVLQQNKQAVQTLSAALRYWKIVYEADSYWQRQREKCQTLHTNKYPFRPETLEQTRRELPLGALAVLVELAIRYVRAGDKQRAQEGVRAMLDSPFGSHLGRQALESLFAPPLLAKGVLNGYDQTRFVQALQSAEVVLDCDPENRQALGLALEAAYAQGEEARNRIIKFAKDALPLFSRARRRFQKFPEQELKSDAQLVSRCKAYWREFGAMLDLATSQAVAEHNSLDEPYQESQRRRLLREVRGYVDCAFNHVLPACAQWTVGDQQWDFQRFDKQLREMGFLPDPTADC